MKLVLLPGLDGTGVLFRPFLKVLPPSIEPIVVSYPTHDPLGYDELLVRVRASLPAEPFALLGESFGGPLSIRIASEQPAGLRALILAGSFISCPLRAVPKWTANFVPAFPFLSFPLYSRLRARFSTYATSEDALLSMEALTQVSAQVFARRVRELIKIEVAQELLACAAPILYLQGERDWVVPAFNLNRIRRIKPVQTAVIPSSHMILKTEPEAAVRAIVNFLATLPNV